MFLVLRPLIIFEMAACSNATAPFVESITQLNKKCQLHCLRVESSLEDTWSMFCWTVQLKLVAGPVIHSGETDMDRGLFNPCRQYLGNTKQYFGNKATHAMRLGTCGNGCQ